MAVKVRSPEAARAAEELLWRLGIADRPIDPFEIAKRHEIVVEPAPEQRALGCLLRVGDTFGISYSTRIRSEGLIRFTVAHELGHYFLPGHPEYLFPLGSGVHISNSLHASKCPTEVEADCFAASLLMPRGLFFPALSFAGRGLAAIECLAAQFGTSLTSTAIQYATLTRDPIAVIVSTRGLVNYSLLSESMRHIGGTGWLPRGEPVPSGTATFEFNRNSQNVRSCRRMNELARLDFWFDGARPCMSGGCGRPG